MTFAQRFIGAETFPSRMSELVCSKLEPSSTTSATRGPPHLPHRFDGLLRRTAALFMRTWQDFETSTLPEDQVTWHTSNGRRG